MSDSWIHFTRWIQISQCRDHWMFQTFEMFQTLERCSTFHLVTNVQETSGVASSLQSQLPVHTPEGISQNSRLTSTLTAALEERKLKQIWPMTHESSHWNQDFHVAVPDHPTTSVSLLCAPINITFCTTPASHRRGLQAFQESKANAQIFLFLLDKNKSPQTRLLRAKAFANIINAFSYLKYNVYFYFKVFSRLNYLRAESTSKIVWSFFFSLFFPSFLKYAAWSRPTLHRLT